MPRPEGNYYQAPPSPALNFDNGPVGSSPEKSDTALILDFTDGSFKQDLYYNVLSPLFDMHKKKSGLSPYKGINFSNVATVVTRLGNLNEETKSFPRGGLSLSLPSEGNTVTLPAESVLEPLAAALKAYEPIQREELAQKHILSSVEPLPETVFALDALLRHMERSSKKYHVRVTISSQFNHEKGQKELRASGIMLLEEEQPRRK